MRESRAQNPHTTSKRQPSPRARAHPGFVRRVVAAACVGMALLLAACDPHDRVYIRDGIGTQLYTADTASATELQSIYLDYLCRQSRSFVGPDVPSCAQD